MGEVMKIIEIKKVFIPFAIHIETEDEMYKFKEILIYARDSLQKEACDEALNLVALLENGIAKFELSSIQRIE